MSSGAFGPVRVKAYVENEWHRQVVNVWVVAPAGEGASNVLHIEDLDAGTLRWERMEQTSPDRAKPTLSLPTDVFAAIVAAGAEAMPPDRAQARHLDDAIKTRDRVFEMLEQFTKPRVRLGGTETSR